LFMLGAAPARASGPPQIGELWASGVVAGAATLNGEVNRNGLATTYHFEYVTAAQFEASGFEGAKRIPVVEDAPVPSGAATFSKVSQHPSSLAAETPYRYRLVAHNSGGTVTSPAFSFVTQGLGGSTTLPDHRGWEMVSPADKNGGSIQGFGANFGGDVLQGAAGGDAVTYSSLSSFGGEAQGAPPASQYLSRRTGGGWGTENITEPTTAGAFGAEPDGVPYQLFSTDLARGLLFDGTAYELRDTLAGGLTPLPPQSPGVSFAGASPDLLHAVLSLEGNLFEVSGGQMEPVSETPGATLAAQGGAVSLDGSRVYFAEEGNLHLREGTHVAQVDEEVGGGGQFQTATPDGAFAFFTKAGRLYRYEARFEDLSTLDLTPSGGVEGVLGASTDGSSVYYAAAGAILLWHGGTTTEVAAAADAGNYPPTTGTARVSADGSHLLFLSRASLTGYDNVDQHSFEPDPEVFLYDAEAPPAGALLCLSCNPTEGRPLGPSTVPGAIANGAGPNATRSYKPRVLTAGGRRVFFDSEDALVLSDTDNAPDVYEWEAQGTGDCAAAPGCLALISRGKEGSASFVDAGESGADAFLLTGVSLAPWADPGSVDVYDAREGGGFPEPVEPFVCRGDACQPLPSPPEDRAVGTLVSGPGNPPVRYSGRHHHHHHHRRGRHRHRHRPGRGR